MRKILLTLAVIALTGAGLNAQVVRNDVIKAYNEGVAAMQTDIPAAIKAFENAIVLADQIGADADDLKEKVIKVLPMVYVKGASNAVAEKKPAAEIIKQAKIAAAVADKYNNAAAKDNSLKIMTQGYNNLASGFFSKNDYNSAVMVFDSILAIRPDYNDALYNKALAYMKMDNADAFEATIDQYIGKMNEKNDTVSVAKASTMALEYFRGAGSKANQAEKLDDAIALLTRAAKYGEDKNTYYYFAEVYNKKKNNDLAVEYAQKGLALETGNDEARAKFYFQLGFAQMGKGQTAEACASFKSASFGAFAEPAKAQLKNLKCE